MDFKKSPIYRKFWTVLQKPKRAFARRAAAASYPSGCRGILCNSFPKSGTHLLLQVLQSLPETNYYGSFLASVGSLHFRLKSQEAHRRRISSFSPREIIPAHLYYSQGVADQLSTMRISHFFIFRDLRDVVVSEAFYLTEHAFWHRLSSRFRSLETLESRLSLSINGLPDLMPNEYPNIGQRFRYYQKWIEDPNCLSIRYEDLIGIRQEQTLREIGTFFAEHSDTDYDIETWIHRATEAIKPQQSHTFRSGRSSSWREHFTPEIASAFENAAGGLNRQLGYT